MTMWIPDLSAHAGPAYRGIAEAIAGAIRERQLRPGERLPTQRELAHELGLTVGTVTRGYAEAKRRGLVSGEVGRGTFVRRERPSPVTLSIRGHHAKGVVDLSLNLPAPVSTDGRLVDTIADMARGGALSGALGYQESWGAERHRACGAAWVARFGVEATVEEVVVTSGGQHSLLAVFAARCDPGDTVLTEALTYPGMTALARLLHLRLEGVPLDRDGLRADALEDACRRHAPKALYLQPTVHNPTAIVMSAARRREIADVARRFDITIVEDDIYGFLAPGAPARIRQLAPERSYYVTSLSKSVLPALRIGFVVAPHDAVESLDRAMMASTWMASPLCAEIARAWVESGVADQRVRAFLDETAARRRIAARILGGRLESTGGDGSVGAGYHLWLPLPEPWRVEDFVSEARSRGALVSSSEMFVVGRGAAPHAIRVCLGAPETHEELETGLEIIAKLLESAPSPVRSSL